MNRDDVRTRRLSRRETAALRHLVVRAVALSDRPDPDGELAVLAAHAPLRALPDAAWEHRLSGTLERSLRRVPDMPSDVLDELRADAEHGGLAGLVHLAALREVGSAFDDHGITWLTMKGPVLAHHLYTRPCDRHYADLDLLVDRQDFQAAVEVLEELDYEHSIHNWRLAEEMLAGEIELTTDVTRIDLHWHLHYSSIDRERTSLVPDEMLERVRHVELAGQRVPTFDVVDTALNLAYHAARSDGHRLIWLKDLERSLVVETPDLDELVRRSLASDCGPQVGVMLVRVRDLLDVPVPDDVIDALIPAPMRVLDRGVRRVSDPVQFHERTTLTRFATRSLGRSTGSTIVELPVRAARRAARRIAPPEERETDDQIMKQWFFDAVAASRR